MCDLLTPDDCASLTARLAPAGASAGSRRLLSEPWCAALARALRTHPRMHGLVPATHAAVQCTLFEKSADLNWLVPIHQDLSIPVAARVPEPTLRGWSEKQGQLFVQAPVGLLEQLVALRLHLDDCAENDGPLRVLPGSHRQGLIDPAAAVQARRHGGERSCPAPLGAALLIRPLLLHASSKASGRSRRRVLHFVFGPRELPFGLRWQDAV